MSPEVSKTLRRYATAILPKVVHEKYPDMQYQLHRWLKRWWTGMNFRERTSFRRLAERGDPLPERFQKLARERRLIVQWPIPPKPKPKKRRHDWGKPHSWRSKHYRRFV